MDSSVAVADYDPKAHLTFSSSAQHPFMVRHDLAEVFDLPLNSVRVIVPFVGGGYGSKSYTKIEPLTAACSWRVSRPVKLQLSVEEAFLTTRSDDARVRIRTAADADGKLVAKAPGDIRIAGETLRSNGPLPAKHGRSVCCSCSDAGAHPVTLAMVHVYADGSVSVMSGSTEIGQGSHTVLAQIAAEEMGIPLEKVRLVGSDTDVTLFERSTGASRTTTLMGRAVMEACREAIAQCKSMAAELLGVPANEFTEERGGIRHGKDWLAWPEIIEPYFQMEGCSIIGRAYLRRAGAF